MGGPCDASPGDRVADLAILAVVDAVVGLRFGNAASVATDVARDAIRGVPLGVLDAGGFAFGRGAAIGRIVADIREAGLLLGCIEDAVARAIANMLGVFDAVFADGLTLLARFAVCGHVALSNLVAHAREAAFAGLPTRIHAAHLCGASVCVRGEIDAMVGQAIAMAGACRTEGGVRFALTVFAMGARDAVIAGGAVRLACAIGRIAGIGAAIDEQRIRCARARPIADRVSRFVFVDALGRCANLAIFINRARSIRRANAGLSTRRDVFGDATVSRIRPDLGRAAEAIHATAAHGHRTCLTWFIAGIVATNGVDAEAAITASGTCARGPDAAPKRIGVHRAVIDAVVVVQRSANQPQAAIVGERHR